MAATHGPVSPPSTPATDLRRSVLLGHAAASLGQGDRPTQVRKLGPGRVSENRRVDVFKQACASGTSLICRPTQTEPARQLVNLRGVPILLVTGEASFRAQYDHCTSKFLTQAGVASDHVRLGDVGIHGNGHMMMLEKNNLEIAAYMDDWLRAKLSAPSRTPHDRR